MSLQNITDRFLSEVYLLARELNVEDDFLLLLQNEMIRRQLDDSSGEKTMDQQ
ncbi:sporulation histidine kinase inhibitor Sda [Thalassobacillus sp. C254]|uniref:sporulation histidine kinase inhibitor Sda n=1 Tax=Thalassobacillus sp. C254 TaxID=1225341 RepID=UPI0018DB5BFB|nr:sporulation histidine kinase inhibitor Sda [Thalassobacillus sp. C254]